MLFRLIGESLVALRAKAAIDILCWCGVVLLEYSSVNVSVY